MEEISTWQAREPKLYQQACELLMMEQSRERVTAQMVRAGLSDEDAAALVADAWGAKRGDRRREGRVEIQRGLGLIVAGIVATIFFSALLTSIGFALVFWGAMLYGAFSAFSGARKLLS